jgi:DNA-binding NtrC family response regulator
MTNVRFLQGRRILVIEDDFLLAETLTDMLEDAGATVVGSIGWRDEAFVFVSRDSIKFDTVIPDINLHGQPSYPIADVLIERGIHFVFVTGYGADAIEAAYRRYLRCEKPFEQKVLFAALERQFQITEAAQTTNSLDAQAAC